MAMGFEINLNAGGALSSLNQINMVAKDINMNLKKTTDAFKGVDKNIQSAVVNQDQMNVSVNRADELVNNVEQEFADAANRIMDMNEAQADFKSLVDMTSGSISKFAGNIPIIGGMLSKALQHPVGNIFDMNEKMKAFNSSFANVARSAGGFEGAIGNLFKSFGANMTLFTKNITNVGALLTKSILPAIGAGFKAIIPAVVGLGAALGPILLAVAAIVAAVYTLKKVWELNIGGIQGIVFEFVGTIKDTLYSSIVRFQKLLQKLEPVFKLVFQPLAVQLKWIGVLFKGLMEIVWAIVDPIADAIAELAEPFASLQGEGVDPLKKAMEVLGQVFSYVAKGISISLKIALFPIKLLAKGIATVIDLVKVLWERFKQTKIFQIAVMALAEGWKQVKEFIDGLIEPFKFLLDTAKEIGKFLGIVEEETEAINAANVPGGRSKGSTAFTSTSQRTTNVAPVITINTSREITSAGARDFASQMSGVIETQAKAG